MFRIAMMPMQEKGYITLLAHKDEWQRFINHLKANRQSTHAQMLSTRLRGETDTMIKVRLPETHARKFLSLAGLSC